MGSLSDQAAEPLRIASNVKTPIVDMAKDEMMALLKDIRNSQSTQCTKNDLPITGCIVYQQTICCNESESDI